MPSNTSALWPCPLFPESPTQDDTHSPFLSLSAAETPTLETREASTLQLGVGVGKENSLKARSWEPRMWPRMFSMQILPFAHTKLH